MGQTLHSRVVRRACDLLGGPKALADRLRQSTGMVRMWLDAELPPPPNIFFRIVDILQEADPDYRVDDVATFGGIAAPPE